MKLHISNILVEQPKIYSEQTRKENLKKSIVNASKISERRWCKEKLKILLLTKTEVLIMREEEEMNSLVGKYDLKEALVESIKEVVENAESKYSKKSWRESLANIRKEI